MVLKPFLRLPVLVVTVASAVAIACGSGATSGRLSDNPDDGTASRPAAGSTAGSARETEAEAAADPATETSGPTETAGPTEEIAGPSAIIEPDYEDNLGRARFTRIGWMTDFSRHTVDFGEILSGGVGRDGIPPLDRPTFTTIEEADAWLGDLEPVVSLEINGEAKGYPLQILTWHEVVNDSVGGVPVTVTFCPLCNSAVAFDRRLEGRVFAFGVSGNLRNSDLIMWDRQTQTWWQQLTGEAIVGQLAGHQLTFIPAVIISWADFKEANPSSAVLSKETGFSRPYGNNPYSSYDRVDQPPFLFDGEPDGRLLPKERVAAVTVGDTAAAFPFPVLEVERVVNYMVGGMDLVVFFKPSTKSALDRAVIIDS